MADSLNMFPTQGVIVGEPAARPGNGPRHLRGLNEQQLAVALSSDKCAVVLAGAGTGKTRAAVAWAADKLLGGTLPEKVALMAFTKKAGAELRERMHPLVGKSGDGMFCGTFHAFAALHLRNGPSKFGFNTRVVSILPQRDAADAVAVAMRWAGITAQKRTKAIEDGELASSSIQIRRYSNGAFALSDVCAAIQYALAHRMAVGEFLSSLTGDEKFLKAYDEYVHFQKINGLVDFDHLLHFFAQTLRDNPQFQLSMAAHYTHILIDEVQDNNALQFDILKNMGAAHKLLIGDVQQSIYRFRGACPEGVSKFMETNPGCKEYRLDLNYRSGREVVDVANYVVAGVENALILIPHRDLAGQAKQYPALSDEGVAARVASVVLEKLDGGAACGDVVILVRTLTAQVVFHVERLLLEKGVATNRVGGSGLLDAPEVLDFYALLRLAHDPQDIVALMRALQLKVGVSQQMAEGMLSRIRCAGDNAGEWEDEVDFIRDPVLLMRSQSMPFSQALTTTLARFRQLYRLRHPVDWEARMEKIEFFVKYCLKNNLSLEECIDEVVLHKPKEVIDDFDGQTVTISTIHSAKGMEWSHVLLLGCGSREFYREGCDSDEFRRMMYVAVTRARDTLSVFWKSEEDELHPFLPSIPRESG